MLELLGRRIEDGEITLTLKVKTDLKITGTVAGVSIHGGKLTVVTDDGQKVEVAAVRTLS